MNQAFLVLLAVYSVFSVAANRFSGADPMRRNASKRWLALQTPMFAVAVVLAWQDGLFSRGLMSPLYIGLGLAGGHLIFVLSLLITHREVKDVYAYMWDVGALWRYIVGYPQVLTRFLTVAVVEEVIWRGVAQPRLVALFKPAEHGMLAVAAGVCVTALAFAVVHNHFFRNRWLVSAEFLGFSVLLGFLYYGTNSLILVIVIHAIRDIEISFLELAAKTEELGNEELAAQELEREYMRQLPEKT